MKKVMKDPFMTDPEIEEQRQQFISAGKNPHPSFATSAAQKRLELLNEGRANAIAVHIEDKQTAEGTASGTKVTIEIPYTLAY